MPSASVLHADGARADRGARGATGNQRQAVGEFPHGYGFAAIRAAQGEAVDFAALGAVRRRCGLVVMTVIIVMGGPAPSVQAPGGGARQGSAGQKRLPAGGEMCSRCLQLGVPWYVWAASGLDGN